MRLLCEPPMVVRVVPLEGTVGPRGNGGCGEPP